MTGPTIVVVAYNRPQSLLRLLSSLERAHYPDNRVNLIISVDGASDSQVCSVASQFTFSHGEKQIISHQKRLGLREHILACGDLSGEVGAIILLEDDLLVSPGFYDFATRMVERYGDEKCISSISLYSPAYNETVDIPFIPLHAGQPIYLMQLPSSWGQVWTPEHWSRFRSWYDGKGRSTVPVATDPRVPPNIRSWADSSWKKHFCQYMIDHNLFCIYPYDSLSTNFTDAGGEHCERESSFLQVPLSYGKVATDSLPSISDVKIWYDSFLEPFPELLRWLCSDDLPADLVVDMYGSKPLDLLRQHRWAITSRDAQHVVRSWPIKAKPPETNLTLAEGEAFFHLAETKHVIEWKQSHRSQVLLKFRDYFGSTAVSNLGHYLSDKLPAFVRRPLERLLSMFQP